MRGTLGEDPTEPFHSIPYAFTPVPDEPPIAARPRRAARRSACIPLSLPLGVDIDAWLKDGKTRWDAFPNTGHGKIDAETAPLTAALADEQHPARDRRRCRAPRSRRRRQNASPPSHYRQNGELKTVSPKLVILSAGAVNSAVILLRSPSRTRSARASPTAPTRSAAIS